MVQVCALAWEVENIVSVLRQDVFPSQEYKLIPANLMLGVTLRWTSIPSRGGVGEDGKYNYRWANWLVCRLSITLPYIKSSRSKIRLFSQPVRLHESCNWTYAN